LKRAGHTVQNIKAAHPRFFCDGSGAANPIKETRSVVQADVTGLAHFSGVGQQIFVMLS